MNTQVSIVMSFTFHKDEEVIHCETLESFRKSLVDWNRRETNTYERVFAVFKPMSRYNWDLFTNDMTGANSVSTIGPRFTGPLGERVQAL